MVKNRDHPSGHARESRLASLEKPFALAVLTLSPSRLTLPPSPVHTVPLSLSSHFLNLEGAGFSRAISLPLQIAAAEVRLVSAWRPVKPPNPQLHQTPVQRPQISFEKRTIPPNLYNRNSPTRPMSQTRQAKDTPRTPTHLESIIYGLPSCTFQTTYCPGGVRWGGVPPPCRTLHQQSSQKSLRVQFSERRGPSCTDPSPAHRV